MNKQFGKLSKLEQEKKESEYHRMKPEDFDTAISRGKKHVTATPARQKRKNKAGEKKRAA